MGEVAHGSLSESDYEKIVGDNNETTAQTQPTEPENGSDKQ